MKKHVKNYLKHHNLTIADVIMCEYCNKEVAVDIHHLVYRSHGGSDEADNLIALGRTSHFNHHNKNNPTSEQLKELNHG